MPRGVYLSDETKGKIYTRFTLNESPEEIAESLDLNPGTVRRIVREQRKLHEREREQMARSGKIVKKDGNGGKLMALSPDGFEFTHVTPDGRSHKKKVTGHISRVAEQQYDKWCQELDDECEFMRKAERRDDEVEQPKAVCGHPGDPIEEIHPVPHIEPAPVPEIAVRPWREVAEERQGRIEELEARISELESELDVAKTQRIEFAEGFQLEMHNPSYLLWSLVDGKPKFYGLYMGEDEALSEIERINEVAAFLGSDGAFEVEEVAWKG